MKILLAKVNTIRLILELVRIKPFQGDTTIMKLKLVVASMSVLGLVSCPVFAANTTMHKHHHKHHAAHHDYKDMGALPYKDQVCTISENMMIMADMTHNLGRALPNPCNPGWFNRIAMSGGVNFDLGKFGNRDGNFMGENYKRASLNDAYLNLLADVNEWAKAFASLSYSTSTFSVPSIGAATLATEYSAAYSNNINTTGSQNIQLEQGFMTIGNLDESPFFLQAGKAFQDFSRYELHPITRSLTQVMSETLATSLNLGFITHGFSGQVYGFDDPISKTYNSETTTNYGASLGYNYASDTWGLDLGAGYLYNLIGVNDVAYLVSQYNEIASAGGTGGYHDRVGGAAAYADISGGPFTLGARYTAAVQRFNATDLPQDGTDTTQGAKPWSAGLQAGYGFDAFGKNNNIYIGYQWSGQSYSLGLPKYRWLAGYGVDIFGKNTNVGIEWDHDSAYSTGSGGTGNNYNLVSLRSSVKFG
jgi:hypothetical protein